MAEGGREIAGGRRRWRITPWSGLLALCVLDAYWKQAFGFSWIHLAGHLVGH